MRFNQVLYLAKYYLKSKLGTKGPILCGIKLTHRCTLRCIACPYWRRPGEDISWQHLTELFPRLYESGVRVVILEGGEPLLWKDDSHTLQDVVRLAKKYFFTVGVTTNGTLPINTGADVVWVSVDGMKDTHESLRGEGFDRIMDNLKNAGDSRLFANITINRRNVEEIPRLVNFLADKVQGITIQFFYPYPETEDITCSAEQRSLVLDQLITLKEQGLPVLDSFAALKALRENTWHCEDWMMANVDPDGTYTHGCYLRNRTDSPSCKWCGFAAHTEISLAYQLNLAAIFAGQRILGIF